MTPRWQVECGEVRTQVSAATSGDAFRQAAAAHPNAKFAPLARRIGEREPWRYAEPGAWEKQP
jgi:hypothetical protein